MENLRQDEIHVTELDEEGMILINTCKTCGSVLSTSLEHVVVYESVKCSSCGKIHTFLRHHIERARDIISRQG